jgi:hypothetical protein
LANAREELLATAILRRLLARWLRDVCFTQVVLISKMEYVLTRSNGGSARDPEECDSRG